MYWNYKNYRTNKAQLVKDVQISLDKAVDDYYAALAQKTTMGFSFGKGVDTDKMFEEGGKFSELLKNIDEKKGQFQNLQSVDISGIDGVTVVKGLQVDSMMTQYRIDNKPISIDSLKAKVKTHNDSIDLSSIQLLTSKVVISIKNDSLDVREVNKLLIKDFKIKNLTLDHHLAYYEKKPDSAMQKKLDEMNSKFQESHNLTVVSNSAFLPKGSLLKLDFSNETLIIVKRIFGGIMISMLLVLAVISCLFYLLKIIKNQKQLAEVKNDLISNITHEFKTPIATIGVALESINSFNAIEDKAKTKKYIDMSSNQLSKLNIMVEKLLETATLDSDNLELNKEKIDLVELLTTLSGRYQTQNSEKTIQCSFKVDELILKVDVFHFENAINNILDNAIKYGGDLISLDLSPKETGCEILISDNGEGINKVNKDLIFEKFYREQKGNTHDVKGFGIGLYYTKTIIDKHNGTIALDLNNALTTFKIELPYV
jgi:two-component system phosphate regulon sensor histidine kinase PhoR